MIPYSDFIKESGLGFRPQIPAKQDLLKQGVLKFHKDKDLLFMKGGRPICLVRMNGKNALVFREDGPTEWKRNLSRALIGQDLIKLTREGIVVTTAPQAEITYAHVAQDEHFERLFLDGLGVMESHLGAISSRTKVLALIALFAGAAFAAYEIIDHSNEVTQESIETPAE